MEYDFLLVGSWSQGSQRQMVAWARELERRGHAVFLIIPARSTQFEIPEDVNHVSIEEERTHHSTLSPKAVESYFGGPSFDHLIFTEREYFRLSREQATDRGLKIAGTIADLFEDNEFRYSLQIRGPEIHRLLVHYATKSAGGISIWVGFSPFKETLALQTTLTGAWDTYRTIPYRDIDEASRETVREHIEEFTEDRKFYAHGAETERRSLFRGVLGTITKLRHRNRPGTLHSQATQAGKLFVNKTVNERLYPTVEESHRLCTESTYALFPLQYPIESRLTLFSPQFYRQEYLVEYLSRILPSTVELFVKAHPSHPGLPSPRTIHRLGEDGRVRFLNPEVNSHHIIENSEGVVVTNNTVGFETMYYRKPLFVLGDAFYSDVPAAVSCRDLGELPEKLSEKLSHEVNRERTISSIHSLKDACFPGDRTEFEDSENVSVVVDSVMTFVEGEE